jgi:glycosyltransferase involved in cell wall biosynthesis
MKPTNIPIIVLASACWEAAGPLNVHHITRRLAERGFNVLFVESTGLRSPAAGSRHDRGRIARRLKRWREGIRQEAPNLHVMSPVALPLGPRVPRLARTASMQMLGRSVNKAAQQLGMKDPILWSFLPSHILATSRIDHRLLIYHCVDDYSGNPGVDAVWLRELEGEMIRCSDLVFASSTVLAERLRLFRPDVKLMSNVADVSLFRTAVTEDLAEPAEMRKIARPRIVYLGNIAAYRIEFDWLLALAQRQPHINQVFIGDVGMGDTKSPPISWARLQQAPNVHVLGPRKPHELPAFLRHCDVAMIPFQDNSHTRASLPLKLWEYVAAGLPVVARDLPNFVGPAQEGAVRLASDEEQFVAEVVAAARETDAFRQRRSTLASKHDWRYRMDELCTCVAQALGYDTTPPISTTVRHAVVAAHHQMVL